MNNNPNPISSVEEHSSLNLIQRLCMQWMYLVFRPFSEEKLNRKALKQLKMECAKRHFKNFQQVQFKVVNSPDALLN